MPFLISELTNINIPVCKGQGSLSVPFLISELTNINIPVSKGESSLSVALIISELTNISRPVGIFYSPNNLTQHLALYGDQQKRQD